jgi:hypothetical protein
MVRCSLDGTSDDPANLVRYIPSSVFELWRFLMETRHGRRVKVEEVSIWLAEDVALWDESFEPEQLQPVLRVQLEKPGEAGGAVPVERFFPAETYPEAREALLGHYEDTCRACVVTTPGYFVPAGAWQAFVASSSSTTH